MPPTKTALITGCSSGIGYELMQLFDTDDFRVVGTALPSSMADLLADPACQSPRVTILPLDVCDYAAGSKLVKEVSDSIGPIDLLINNAGISFRSVVEDMSEADEQKQMQVNYLGPMHLIRACLPQMRQRRSGHIINLSSVGGMMAMPTMASYSASKFAIEGASEALWYELRPWGINVTLVRPGFINSLAFTKVIYARKKLEGLGSSEYDQHYENMTAFVENIMSRTPCTSRHVARKVRKIADMKRPPLRAAGTPDALLFYLVRRLLPRALYHRFLYATLPEVKSWGPK